MISLIVCSVNKVYLENLKKSVQETIGLEYELLATDNTVLKQGICKVYNDAAAKAKYPYLCFVHEDIAFCTPNWGSLMVETLQNKRVGILGFCGGKYYPDVPGGWLDIPHSLRRFNMVYEVDGKKGVNCVQDSPENLLTTTVTLDGMLLAMRKNTWEEFHFNEEVVKGFEFYDIEICLRVQQKYQLVIDHRILVQHFGVGRYVSKQWLLDALHFYDHKTVRGPVSLVSSPSSRYLEDFAFKRFLERVAAIDDEVWKRNTLVKLLQRFPLLMIKNFFFYLDVTRKMAKS